MNEKYDINFILISGNNDQSISLADMTHVVGEHRDITNVSEDHS